MMDTLSIYDKGIEYLSYPEVYLSIATGIAVRLGVSRAMERYYRS